jgi:D-amino-acid dehydrogenase
LRRDEVRSLEARVVRVAVLGGGVIGVTTAYELALAGHEVVVIDRQPYAGLETSFGNAGEISPGYASPWAAPGVPRKAISWLLAEHAPLILRPKADPHMLRWLLGMLRNCTAERYKINKNRMMRVAELSRERLAFVRAQTGIAYDERMQGTLQLFRKQAQLDGAAKDIEVLGKSGVPFEVLDKAGCIAAEPGLACAQEPFVGGLRLPNDETGDCHKFTVALATQAAALGVRFVFDTTIKSLTSDGRAITGVVTDKGVFVADDYVVALGSYSPLLLRPLGLEIPVYPVKGYSLTADIIDEPLAPVSTVLDETYKVAITRLGDRIRIGGMAEISGFSTDLPLARRATLARSAGSLFPSAGDLENASFWSGLRPMTPDGTPVIGATAVENLFLNTGHGTLGWTMACGSAQVLAALISGQESPIEHADLAMSRY